jgi:hypothetical protein
MIVPDSDESLHKYSASDDKHDVPLVTNAASFAHADPSQFERMGMVGHPSA